jgi:hypothetical protein
MRRILLRYLSPAFALILAMLFAAPLAHAQPIRAVALHAVALLAIAIPDWLNPLIGVVLPMLTGFISSKTFEPFQAIWAWLNTTHPLVRFLGSGVWGGLVAYLATLGITLPSAPGGITASVWATIVGALFTWAWHALTKSSTKASTPVARTAGTPPRAL